MTHSVAVEKGRLGWFAAEKKVAGDVDVSHRLRSWYTISMFRARASAGIGEATVSPIELDCALIGNVGTRE